MYAKTVVVHTFSDPVIERLHPITQEFYRFKLIGNIFATANRKNAEASVFVNCERGDQECCIFTYRIEEMPIFPLLSLLEQYRELLWNWMITSDDSTIITEVERCFQKGAGPVVKINGKTVKSLNMDIVVVEE